MKSRDLIKKYPHFCEFLWGIECGDGWAELLDELIGKILAIDPEAQADFGKERYDSRSL